MNENLNLVKILKDCPQGTKLYSSVYGEVELLRIGTQKNYPIECEATKDKSSCYFTKDGREISRYVDGECVLFPSKDQRDWSKFKVEPKFDISTLQPFDKILCRVDNSSKWRCGFFSHFCNICYKFFCSCGLYTQCIPYNEDIKHLVGSNELPTEKYINWEE